MSRNEQDNTVFFFFLLVSTIDFIPDPMSSNQHPLPHEIPLPDHHGDDTDMSMDDETKKESLDVIRGQGNDEKDDNDFLEDNVEEVDSGSCFQMHLVFTFFFCVDEQGNIHPSTSTTCWMKWRPNTRCHAACCPTISCHWAAIVSVIWITPLNWFVTWRAMIFFCMLQTHWTRVLIYPKCWFLPNPRWQKNDAKICCLWKQDWKSLKTTENKRKTCFSVGFDPWKTNNQPLIFHL